MTRATLVSLVILVGLITFAVALRETDWKHKHWRNKFDQSNFDRKRRTMETLARAPVEDLDSIELDEDGVPYFVDTFVYIPDTESEELQKRVLLELLETEQTTNVFALHGCPTCINKIYIDFTGETIVNSAWSRGSGSITGTPYSADADTSTFSTWERNVIQDIWARVVEDFKPFNVDITTEPPAGAPNTWSQNVLHCVVTKSDPSLPSYIAGGVGYVGIFGKADTWKLRPAWVYYDHLGGANNTRTIASAISHEIGHNLGLSHDGTVATATQAAAGYYTGHGTGPTSWGPIMGSSPKTLTQWSKGEYPLANNKEDDLAIISSQLGYVTPTTVLSPSTFAGCDAYYTGTSVITSATDEDTWPLSLSPPSGRSASITITATPWTSAFRPSDSSFNGNNLDISLTYGTQTAAPLGISSATLSASNVAMSSQIKVRGSGEKSAATDFSNYGSIGFYKITVCAKFATSTIPSSPPTAPPPTTPPPTKPPTTPPPTTPTTPPPTKPPPTTPPTSGSCTSGVCCNLTTKKFYPSTHVCRQKAGPCDAIEYCTGNSATCPADKIATIGTVCRASVGPCDKAETCNGVIISCPTDAFAPVATVCRPAAGPCDIADTCSGTSATCGPDYLAFGSTCRASTGECDVAEKCDGKQTACPTNSFAAVGSSCRTAAGRTGRCSSTGKCS